MKIEQFAICIYSFIEKLRENGLRIAGEVRAIGDGYYESVVLDPEGNRIEITV